MVFLAITNHTRNIEQLFHILKKTPSLESFLEKLAANKGFVATDEALDVCGLFSLDLNGY